MVEEADRRGPYAKSARRKEQIARAALEIVDAVGHDKLTTAAVAAVVGMSERAVTYHFATRDDILVAALALSDAEVVTEMPAGAKSYAESFDLIPDRIVRFHMTHPNRQRLFNLLSAQALDAQHPAHEYIRAHSQETVAALAELVAGRQRLGLAHPDLDAESVARQMLATWNGLTAQWTLDSSFDLADELKAAFHSLTGAPTMQARAVMREALAQI
ncbi:TetR/AcrR family transcriptional regulator [Microbacterium sp. NPDC089698]|uniref:TetR/AcrR family transcriptional regulator n=1 Tax=Microbacterium sp. NPDC089698 TaxID=3364200 RepID=UPI0038100A74